MAETPDFDRIARRLSGVWADRGAIDGMTEAVAAQLRLVWNARGVANSEPIVAAIALLHVCEISC